MSDHHHSDCTCSFPAVLDVRRQPLDFLPLGQCKDDLIQ